MWQTWVLVLTAVALAPPSTASGEESRQPNIVWLSCEDISPHLGCYGDADAITPNIDRLATEGVRYTRAFTTAGVCAPCRSGIITGIYQTTLGTHHMRCTATLPNHIRPFPTYRWWAATGIGNLGKRAKGAAKARMRRLLKDESSAVRTAAARALCRMGEPDGALPVLIDEMTTGTQWARLHAAIVLDEIDEQARPVIDKMKAGLEYQPGFNSQGKYRVRVINRALNELLGTNRRVR